MLESLLKIQENPLPTLKRCNKCGEEKLIGEFYFEDYQRVDGSVVVFPYGYCKKCHNKRMQDKRDEDREKWLAYHNNYNKTYKRKSRAGQKKKKGRNMNMVRTKNTISLYMPNRRLKTTTTVLLTKLFHFLKSDEKNAWLENRTAKLYVRKSKRFIENGMLDFIDLATIGLKRDEDMGQGFLHHFLSRLLKTYPDKNFYIENILNDRIPKHLIEFGFKIQPGTDLQPCMYLIKNKNETLFIPKY